MMCGIFGIVATSREKKKALGIAKKLMLASEKRGKDGSGAFISNGINASIFKSDDSALNLWRNVTFKNVSNKLLEETNALGPIIIAGHTRMITHGDLKNSNNNQPIEVISGSYILHNGVIVNWKDLALTYKIDNYLSKSDTVIFAEILKQQLVQTENLIQAFNLSTKLIEGANNIVLIDTNDNNIFFYSSNGSLYYLIIAESEQIIFASEKKIIEDQVELIYKNRIHQFPKDIVVELKNISSICDQQFPMVRIGHTNKLKSVAEFIINKNIQKVQSNQYTIPHIDLIKKIENSIDYEKINQLRRCTICILPETYPNINFDNLGRCNICLSYEKKKILGRKNLLSKFPSKDKLVIVPLSGGRDSSYALHYLKEDLKLNVVAYTYDWGFVSNSARENISRMCGELGVEHLLLAADINKKRSNVKKNLIAWLHRPVLGMIPILMAGDKQFLTLAEKIRKENSAFVSIFAMNSFERTGFKSGFAGVSENYDKKRFHGLSAKGRFKIFLFYCKQVIQNLRYINTSILDSVFGFFSFYGVKTNYLQIFDFIEWDEENIMNILKSKYGWKIGDGQLNSWRSGDATAGFYNYLYLRFAGLTEFDTFRSNQIRENYLDRSTALHMIDQENKVQTQDFLEYLKTIDLSPEYVLNKLGNRGRFAKT